LKKATTADREHRFAALLQGGILVPAYAAAKGGVAQLTKALANEWPPKGINVNAIAPGYMITDTPQLSETIPFAAARF